MNVYLSQYFKSISKRAYSLNPRETRSLIYPYAPGPQLSLGICQTSGIVLTTAGNTVLNVGSVSQKKSSSFCQYLRYTFPMLIGNTNAYRLVLLVVLIILISNICHIIPYINSYAWILSMFMVNPNNFILK